MYTENDSSNQAGETVKDGKIDSKEDIDASPEIGVFEGNRYRPV